MENGDEMFASPTAAAAEFEQALTNGGGAGEVYSTKSYNPAEIDALRETKRDLEEKLAATSHENRFLAAEAFRLEGVVCQAMEDIATAEHAAAASEDEAATLRAEVKRLKGLLAAEKSDHETELRKSAELDTELQGLQKEVVILEEELNALKASAAATSKKDIAASLAVQPKEAEVAASHGLMVATAAGAAATAAIVIVILHLKRLPLSCLSLGSPPPNSQEPTAPQLNLMNGDRGGTGFDHDNARTVEEATSGVEVVHVVGERACRGGGTPPPFP